MLRPADSAGAVTGYQSPRSAPQGYSSAAEHPEAQGERAAGGATIIRITSGNFGLTTRLMAQVHRIMEINQFSTVTSEVVSAACESLVIGVM